VGLFLRVDDFDQAYDRMLSMGVEFITEPRHEAYGQVAVFRDITGNSWDLLGPNRTAERSFTSTSLKGCSDDS
jgi:uncharacterized glyoxalase superfamily protein PhnB